MAIDILPGAKQDMAALRKSDPDALAVIASFLEEAAADKELIDKCTTHGDNAFGPYLANVKAWVQARRQSDNLFRIRILETPATNYRIVYGYDWHTRRIGILAVVKKGEHTYDMSGQLANRIQTDWDRATGGRPT